MLAALGIDEAMRPLILARAWSLCAGPVTMYLVARSLSPEEQGFAYTFINLMALQMFLELGFSQSVIQFTAQEGAHLTLTNSRILEGAVTHIARVASLFRFFICWYAVLALLFFLVVGSAGYWFLSHGHDHGIRWVAPWFLLVVGTSLSMILLPFWHVLSGLNQVAVSNRISATNAMALNVVTWIVLLLGGRLFSNPTAALVSFALVQARLIYPYRHLWLQLWQTPAGEIARIDFRRDILPFQWRITFTFLTSYFVFELFTPLCFRLVGPAEAGRLGMTLALLLTVTSLCQAFVSNKYPQLSMLFARGEHDEMRATFRSAYLRCVSLAAVGLLVSIPILALLRNVPVFSNRLLGSENVAIMAFAAFLQAAGLPFVYFVRAHRKEPFIAVAWAQAVVTPLAIYALGQTLGVRGITLAYLISWGIGTPWLYAIFRTFWKHPHL